MSDTDKTLPGEPDWRARIEGKLAALEREINTLLGIKSKPKPAPKPNPWSDRYPWTNEKEHDKYSNGFLIKKAQQETREAIAQMIVDQFTPLCVCKECGDQSYWQDDLVKRIVEAVRTPQK